MFSMREGSRRAGRRTWGVESLEDRRLMTFGPVAQFAPGWGDAVDVRFGRYSSHFQESAGVVPITITRGGDLSLGAGARVRTATVDALEGYDYLGLDQPVTFAPGSATATFYLTILDDDVSEPLMKALDLQVYRTSDVLSDDTVTSMRVLIEDDEPGSVGPLIFHAFGDAGLWTYNDAEGYRKINNASPEAIYSAPNRGAYLDFGPAGLWYWDALRGYEKLNAADPQAILTPYQGESLLIDFGHDGLWNWSRADGYSKVTDVDPEAMAGTADRSLVDFGPAGLWLFDGASWLKLDDESPEAILVGDQDDFYIDYGPRGFWRTRTSIINVYTLDGCFPTRRTNLEQLNPADPTTITPAGHIVFVGFGAAGLWRYDGAWAKLNDVAPSAVALGSRGLYMNFGDAGLWLWSYDDGDWRWDYEGKWSKIHDLAPRSVSRVTAVGLYPSNIDVLDFDYGDAGLWRGASTASEWKRLSPARVTAHGYARMDTGVNYTIILA